MTFKEWWNTKKVPATYLVCEEAWNAAIAAEREACAKIADEQAGTVNSRWIAEEIATSIRARGETK